jgi:hypothetical protein
MRGRHGAFDCNELRTSMRPATRFASPGLWMRRELKRSGGAGVARHRVFNNP